MTRSSADQKLTVKIERAGYLLAFGSARPHMKENFYSDTHTTFYGKALAVIRAGYEPGDIKVSVSGEGLETQSVVISVREEMFMQNIRYSTPVFCSTRNRGQPPPEETAYL